MKKLRHWAFALAASMLLSPAANASDWGCQVLLCLANPAGPMAVTACVPPITKLWEAIKKPKPDPFPTCEEAKSGSGDSFAKQGYGYFDQCPMGTTALPAGVAAIQASASVYADLAKSNPVYLGTDLQPATKSALVGLAPSVGIGDGDALQPSIDQPLPAKVCVSSELGTVTLPGTSAEAGAYQVDVFEQVVILPAEGSPTFIDVFVNGQLYKRVRY